MANSKSTSSFIVPRGSSGCDINAGSSCSKPFPSQVLWCLQALTLDGWKKPSALHPVPPPPGWCASDLGFLTPKHRWWHSLFLRPDESILRIDSVEFILKLVSLPSWIYTQTDESAFFLLANPQDPVRTMRCGPAPNTEHAGTPKTTSTSL